MHTAVRVWDYTWWMWFANASLILMGLLAGPDWFLVAIGLALVQAVLFIARTGGVSAFPAQLRIGFLVFLAVAYIPPLRLLYWVPAIGTFAMLFFGYCLLARLLSLFPWNRTEPLSLRLLRETFFSRPRLDATVEGAASAGCPGGVCSLEVQVGRQRPKLRVT